MDSQVQPGEQLAPINSQTSNGKACGAQWCALLLNERAPQAERFLCSILKKMKRNRAFARDFIAEVDTAAQLGLSKPIIDALVKALCK